MACGNQVETCDTPMAVVLLSLFCIKEQICEFLEVTVFHARHPFKHPTSTGVAAGGNYSLPLNFRLSEDFLSKVQNLELRNTWYAKSYLK